MCDTKNESTSDLDRSLAPPDRGERDRTLAARFADYEDGPAECTLYPRDASGVDLMSRWITASEGSYVPLDEMQ